VVKVLRQLIIELQEKEGIGGGFGVKMLRLNWEEEWSSTLRRRRGWFSSRRDSHRVRIIPVMSGAMGKFFAGVQIVAASLDGAGETRLLQWK
jgi:hypothetical protein